MQTYIHTRHILRYICAYFMHDARRHLFTSNFFDFFPLTYVPACVLLRDLRPFLVLGSDLGVCLRMYARVHTNALSFSWDHCGMIRARLEGKRHTQQTTHTRSRAAASAHMHACAHAHIQSSKASGQRTLPRGAAALSTNVYTRTRNE